MTICSNRCRSLLLQSILCCAAVAAFAEDKPAAPAPAPAPPPAAAPPTPQPLPLRNQSANVPPYHRPHQVTEVIEVESAEDLQAKLHALVEGGLTITSMATVPNPTGKSLLIVVGMPQPQMMMRPGPIQPPGRPAPAASVPQQQPQPPQPQSLTAPGPQ